MFDNKQSKVVKEKPKPQPKSNNSAAFKARANMFNSKTAVAAEQKPVHPKQQQQKKVVPKKKQVQQQQGVVSNSPRTV